MLRLGTLVLTVLFLWVARINSTNLNQQISKGVVRRTSPGCWWGWMGWGNSPATTARPVLTTTEEPDYDGDGDGDDDGDGDEDYDYDNEVQRLRRRRVGRLRNRTVKRRRKSRKGSRKLPKATIEEIKDMQRLTKKRADNNGNKEKKKIKKKNKARRKPQ